MSRKVKKMSQTAEQPPTSYEAAGRIHGDDVEKQPPQQDDRDNTASGERKQSAFKSLGWLDRFLAVWILLSMIIGILLGNFVPNTNAALEKGKFVGVSVPIGMP
jgi:ACR3 family arsenite transporter